MFRLQDQKGKKITEIALHTPCTIVSVHGSGRLRFFDLGFFVGSQVIPMYECTGGGTRVYMVKDTLIALRNGDGALILAEEGEI